MHNRCFLGSACSFLCLMGKRCVRHCLCRHKKNKTAFWLNVCESRLKSVPFVSELSEKSAANWGPKTCLHCQPASESALSALATDPLSILCTYAKRDTGRCPGLVQRKHCCYVLLLFCYWRTAEEERQRKVGGWLEKGIGIGHRDTVRDTYTQGEAGRQAACSTENRRESVSKEVKEKEREIVAQKKVREAGGGRRGRVVGEDHVL